MPGLAFCTYRPLETWLHGIWVQHSPLQHKADGEDGVGRGRGVWALCGGVYACGESASHVRGSCRCVCAGICMCEGRKVFVWRAHNTEHGNETNMEKNRKRSTKRERLAETARNGNDY